MKVQQLSDTLAVAGFKEEKLDTGYNFTKIVNHIELVCYIEPDINVAFTTIYKWQSNEVKGTYVVSMKEFERNDNTADSFFKKAVAEMPESIGLKSEGGLDIHHEVKTVIDETF